MIKLTKFGCAVVMLCVSSVAWAGGESGFYLGASVGSAGSDVSYTQAGIGNVDYSDSDSGYKVFLGYNFGLIPLVNFAVEGSYVDFGTAKGSVSGNNAETSITGLNAFGVVGFNLGPIALFGKVGAINWDAKSSVQSANSFNSSGTDPAYGIGLQFQLGSIAVRAEYEVFDTDTVDIGFASAGLSFTF